jgi:hypothetical protein
MAAPRHITEYNQVNRVQNKTECLAKVKGE